MRENVHEAMRTVLDSLAYRAIETLDDPFVDAHWPDILARSGPGGAPRQKPCPRWARADPRPLVLFVDENRLPHRRTP